MSMHEGRPCCPNCGESEYHEELNVISLRMLDMTKVMVYLLTCKECGTVFDPRFVRKRETG